MAETSQASAVLVPADDDSAVPYPDWIRRLDAAVAAGEITQHEADVAEFRDAWPFPDEVKAAFVGPDRITVYDEAHLPLIRKRPDDLTPAERRMTPVIGELRRNASGDLVCIPTTRNGQRQAHRDLLEDVAAAGGIAATLPPTGRPADQPAQGSGRASSRSSTAARRRSRCAKPPKPPLHSCGGRWTACGAPTSERSSGGQHQRLRSGLRPLAPHGS